LGIGRQEDQFCFEMETIKTEAMPEHKPKLIFIPIHLLPFLRDQMAKMLVEFDGTEEIGPHPTLPKWIKENGILLILLLWLGKFKIVMWKIYSKIVKNASKIICC
jgi:hypothetical protein